MESKLGFNVPNMFVKFLHLKLITFCSLKLPLYFKKH